MVAFERKKCLRSLKPSNMIPIDFHFYYIMVGRHEGLFSLYSR